MAKLCIIPGDEGFVGLSKGAQPPGSGEQAVVHPRQENGQNLRRGEDQGFRDGQVPQGTSFQPVTSVYNTQCISFIFKRPLKSPKV